jgi:hypothetical protein
MSNAEMQELKVTIGTKSKCRSEVVTFWEVVGLIASSSDLGTLSSASRVNLTKKIYRKAKVGCIAARYLAASSRSGYQ